MKFIHEKYIIHPKIAKILWLLCENVKLDQLIFNSLDLTPFQQKSKSSFVQNVIQKLPESKNSSKYIKLVIKFPRYFQMTLSISGIVKACHHIARFNIFQLKNCHLSFQIIMPVTTQIINKSQNAYSTLKFQKYS